MSSQRLQEYYATAYKNDVRSEHTALQTTAFLLRIAHGYRVFRSAARSQNIIDTDMFTKSLFVDEIMATPPHPQDSDARLSCRVDFLNVFFFGL